MGRKKKGGRKSTGPVLANAVSDEDEGGAPDGLYDEVDTWANQQEEELASVLKKVGPKKRRDTGNVEMYALSGTDSDSDLELPKVEKQKKKKKGKKSAVAEELEELDEDFLGSDVEADAEENVGAWGSRKKHFYGGNTGVGMVASSDSEFDEDEEEQKEAELLQARQLDRLEEEDFLDTFIQPDNKDTKKEESTAAVDESVKRDLSALSPKELAALFRQQNPEFDGIVLDFKEKMAQARQLSRLVGLEDCGQLPPGPGLQFVRIKFQLLTNYCTNIAAYLMFKAKGTNLKLHPVAGRLVEYKQLIDSLESMDAIIQPQIDSLLSRLENGELVENVVKEEKRRFRKKEMKKKIKSQKLNILQKPQAPEVGEPAATKPSSSTSKKRKVDRTTEDLTMDEKLAVELYKAIKRNKTELDDDDDDEEQEDGDVGEESGTEDPVTDNRQTEEPGEEAKRGITYQIAKNKGLTPKRNKLNRNPRVKNRVKFEKAKVRRKGAVREVRKELSRYGGELSGINARVRKGVKIS